MKRASLQRARKFLLVASLVLSGVNGLAPEIASAAVVGSGNCIQNVDSATDVVVVSANGYCYIAFKSGSRTWDRPSNVSTIDYLVVAGGGSGGARHGGGGGAGGLLKAINVSISNIASLSITVGTGGASVVPSGGSIHAVGLPGNNSTLSKAAGSGSFTTVTAIGGGGGEAGGSGSQSGGSGGGAQNSTRGAGTVGQGNAGGTGGSGSISGATNWWSGGGGGAGAQGGDGSTSGGGSGGSGAIWLSDFTNTIASSLGLALTNQVSANQVFFAGGGGGAITLSYTPGIGGLGGGGAAVSGNNTGVSGTANSGGGGGGTGCCNGGPTGAGGSGIVLIRYGMPSFTNSATFSTTENILTSNNAAIISVSESSTIAIQPTLDHALFTIIFIDSVTAHVRFLSPPDYEAASDIGVNNEYDLSIRATNTSGNYQDFSIKISVTDVLEAATINALTLSDAVYKGRPVTITVTASSLGKVRFFVAGKRITNCLAEQNSGSYPNYSAACVWKPSISGSQSIKATLTPTNVAIGAVTSSDLRIFIYKRSNTR